MAKPFTMLMKHKPTGHYVKVDLEAFRSGAIEHPWLLTPEISEATNDPGFVNGHDLSMDMLFLLPRGEYTCTSPEEEEKLKCS